MIHSSTKMLNLAFGVALLVAYAPGSRGAPSFDSSVSRYSLIGDPHIINGVDTDIEKVPYQIAVEYHGMHLCGGAIVSENWTLTAAHCVSYRLTGDNLNKRIRAGSTMEIPFIGWRGSLRDIEFIVPHKLFRTDKMGYNIAAVRVIEKFQFGPKIKPIAIPIVTEKQFVDYKQDATVSGYGNTRLEPILPSFHLKSAVISLIPREECQAMVSAIVSVNITSTMICAGDKGPGGKGVFTGDSGGPLVQKGQLIGIVSWLMRQFDPSLPSVFVNLLHPEIRSFIKKATKV